MRQMDLAFAIRRGLVADRLHGCYAERMPFVSSDDVAHIARLARLRVTPEDAKRFADELTAIFAFVDQLNEVSTDGVEPTAQVTGLSSVVREDVVLPSQATPDALLASSPLPTIDRHIAAPHAHG